MTLVWRAVGCLSLAISIDSWLNSTCALTSTTQFDLRTCFHKSIRLVHLLPRLNSTCALASINQFDLRTCFHDSIRLEHLLPRLNSTCALASTTQFDLLPRLNSSCFHDSIWLARLKTVWFCYSVKELSIKKAHRDLTLNQSIMNKTQHKSSHISNIHYTEETRPSKPNRIFVDIVNNLPDIHEDC